MSNKNLLLIENKRTKYLVKTLKIFQRETSMKKWQKFRFKFLNIKLTNEILDEVDKPIVIPVEIIMNDINFIQGNFSKTNFFIIKREKNCPKLLCVQRNNTCPTIVL